MTKQKERRILLAEAAIILVVLLASLLPQVTGTVSAGKERGALRSTADLNGRVFGAAAGSELEALCKKRWPAASVVEVQDPAAMPEMTEDGVIDAFLAMRPDAEAILEAHPRLTVLFNMNRNAMFAGSEEAAASGDRMVCVLVRAADCAYLTTETTLADMRTPGLRIAGMTGTEMAEFPALVYPECEVLNYNSFTDMFVALESGRADAAAAFLTQLSQVEENYDDLAFISIPMANVTCGFGLRSDARGDRLREEFNRFLAEIVESGEFAEICGRWAAADQTGGGMPDFDFTGEKGTLRVVTSGEWFPMSYFSGSTLTGQFIEIASRFSLKEGYVPEFECAGYSAQIAGINTGAYDMMANTCYITPERLQKINITDPVVYSDMYLVVRVPPETEEVPRAAAFLERLKSGFVGNFIREDRWRMLLSGLGTTLVLALLSVAAGTLLGALICRLRMSRNTLAEAFARLYVRVIQGIPILVLLMLLYYVILNSRGLSAPEICVIGFSLDFAAYASEIFRSGIRAVPPGQARAAKALGFGRVRGFVKVVLPQALRHILPVYSGQVISLVKITSVAGYISVLELTKVSDIIRSRTFDAFFPLITSALVYFLLAHLLTGLMRLASGRLLRRGGNRALRELQGLSAGGSRTETAAEGAPRGTELLTVEHLSKRFGQVTPIRDVSCTIRSGDVISVIGPSGTGKSTFLNLINRLEEPDGGRILFAGEDTCERGCDLTRLRQRVGMVFQSFNLFSHLTIVENVMLAQTELKKRSRQEAYGRAMALLEAVGLSGKALSYPSELSGGQQQRAAIARTLAMDPEIVLFDEPTSALDPTMVGEVLAVIRKLAQKGVTMLVVTHEMQFARDVSTRVFYMDEGVIYEEGSPEKVFEQPEKEKTRQFIRRLKVFHWRIEGDAPDFPALIGAVEEFAQKHMLSRRLYNGLMTVAEELCIDRVFSRQSDHSPIDLDAEYDRDREEIRFTVAFTGGDPLLDADALPVRLLRNACSSLAFTRREDRSCVEGWIRSRPVED